MSTQSDTPETDNALYPMNGVDIVWPDFARKLERERDQLRRWTSVNGVLEMQRERDEARADAIRWQSIAEGRGRTDDESENDTQAELAAWEMLEIARRERDEARRQLAELQDQIVMESDTKKPLRETSNKLP